jgi:arginine-tRNA-protein transferase
MGDSVTEQIVDDFLSRQTLPTGPEFPCPYLPGLQASSRAFMAHELHPEIYEALLNRGFRRSGNIFYQPHCASCRECVQIRVPTERFTASRSQRRVRATNQDVRATVGRPHLTQEKWRLYAEYLKHQHDGSMSDQYEDLFNFLYRSPVHTIEICYTVADTLVGVSIADQSNNALSTVYMFFDARRAERSLGTFSVLWEIDYCRRSNIPYYYLGFYIKDCGKMNYKANFRPYQLLTPDFEWVECD